MTPTIDNNSTLVAYLLTCKHFNTALRVRDGVCYVYDTAAGPLKDGDPGRRCGYFTASGLIGGLNKNTHNACSLLMDVCKRSKVIPDFSFPGYMRLVRPGFEGAQEVARA